MHEPALLVTEDNVSKEDRHVARVLDFFGINHTASQLEFPFLQSTAGSNSEKIRLLCSANVLLRFIKYLEEQPRSGEWGGVSIHSAFVYSNEDVSTLQQLCSKLAGDGIAQVRPNSGAAHFSVTDQLNDFCKIMAGLRVSCSSSLDTSVFLPTMNENAVNIISASGGAVFVRFEYKGVPVFVSTSRNIVDLDAELTSQNFNVRDHFLSAVPLMLYVKWAFAKRCWSAPEINACLVIDDPVLKPTHGFVDFQDLLSLMKQHNFSTNIAFIPWNWRRTGPDVARLFRDNPEHYSLSVHGCDHTRAEFGSSSQQRLYWKARQAIQRMDRHRSITGIHHDPVMVFPQGMFSEAAMSALKHTELIAAVNNDVVSADPCPRAIKISDVWDIAIMGYPFPLFTRRYPWEGIENFAFDALLGKPAIAVIHHDYCSDHGARLVSFVQALNALQCAPTWRGLGDVLRRSCRQREVSPGTVEVEMYGKELRIENRSDRPKRFVIRRRECEPSAIQRICTDSQEIAWKSVNGHIDSEVELNPGENQMIRVKFQDLADNTHMGDSLLYRVKARLRRYLCEVRDNYLVPTKAKFAGAR
jgi:hypothetical protein